MSHADLFSRIDAEPMPADAASDAPARAIPMGDAAAAEQGDARPDGHRRGAGRDRPRRDRGEDAAPAAAPIETIASVASTAYAASPFEASAHASPSTDLHTGEQSGAAPFAAPFAAPLAAKFEAPPARPAAQDAVAPPPYVLPMADLQAVAAASGLEWINSDADKARAVHDAMAREPQPVHVPRERAPLLKVDEGPLVLVETRKDLSQIKLPFETSEVR